MEKEKNKNEREKIQKAILDLQHELNHDLTQGFYYGMDRKIRQIQKALILLLRV